MIVGIIVFFGIIFLWIVYEFYKIYRRPNVPNYTREIQKKFITLPIKQAAHLLPTIILAIGMTTLINSSPPFSEKQSKEKFKRLLTEENIKFFQNISLPHIYTGEE